MISDPSPLNRLLRLEAAVDKLQSQAANVSESDGDAMQSAPRHVWPADELLLTRLLRRSPKALLAYAADAEISVLEERGVILELSQEKSLFQLCELENGDAVVWIRTNSPEWLYKSDSFRAVFGSPSDIVDGMRLAVQKLPLFKPIVRGSRWTLLSRGEVLPQGMPFPEESENENILKRLGALERSLARLLSSHDVAMRDLAAQLKEQQAQLDSLMRITIR